MLRSKPQLLVMLSAVAVLACGGEPVTTDQSALTVYQVATYNAETGAIGPINTAILNPVFLDGTEVKQVAIREVGAHKVLVRRGLTAANNCRLTGTKLFPGGGYLNAADEGKTHSCSGTNCDGCSFRTNDDGEITGCDCTGNTYGYPAYCSHSVTTTEETEVFQTQTPQG